MSTFYERYDVRCRRLVKSYFSMIPLGNRVESGAEMFSSFGIQLVVHC